VPCDVLFIGEAPGESEDAIGIPFIGPAGHLLGRIIDEALQHFSQAIIDTLRIGFTKSWLVSPRGRRR
jgi:DNA polymerase